MNSTLHSRSGIDVRAEIVTWDVCVLRICVGQTSFVVCLPGDQFDSWLQQFTAGLLDDELLQVASAPPRRSLRSVPRSVRQAQRERAPRIGIEHEFEVRRDGRQIDFRQLLPHVPVARVRADPADPLAARFPWGVVTADGLEAEIATAPIKIESGFVGRAIRAAEVAAAELRDICADHELVGFSTHISVSWHARRDDRLAQTWARVFGPVMMLLLDRPTSPGLVVRPRPGRLELCGEYATGDQLAAAVAFAAGSVQTVQRLSTRQLRRCFVDMSLQPSLDRYGWYIDRKAMGEDLYALGRRTVFMRGDGTVTAERHAHEIIEMVASDLSALGGAPDLLSLQSVTTGEVRPPLFDFERVSA